MKITFPERSGMSFAGLKDTLLRVRRPYNILGLIMKIIDARRKSIEAQGGRRRWQGGILIADVMVFLGCH
jgi:hypothetical protein